MPDAFQLVGISSRNRIQTTEAYSSFDLTKVQYNVYMESREEKFVLLTRPSNLIHSEKYIGSMIAEVEFRIYKYTRVLSRVGRGYGGLTKFMVEDQRISLPRERNNS